MRPCTPSMFKLLIFIVGCASIALTGCSIERLPGVYRIDVQQGNVITQEMLEKLSPGMSKQQVSFVLGSPLLIDSFHPDRWYYIYSFKPGNERRKQRTITMWFEEGKLSYVGGDVEIGIQRGLQQERREGPVSISVPPRQEDEGLLGSLMDMLDFSDSSSEDEDTKENLRGSSEDTALPPSLESEINKNPVFFRSSP
ncbi:SmpA/OmlA [Nitrosococcus oceani ATCC 19707]|uniref:Outer membrane protein assembly factor BamE n=3 Tax=Nitrosococcus oceani TaxID=1229 RepID=Q3JBU9_NITOC|nr:SmpA/OmlA [Nitrosococcus oceani ATCC 19707]KFI19866.1 membrane protein SmpA [Nitrosococcus oceani C-27]GEM19347.1 outer membrane protein assembly factor BamE [Nitrosococcus oceani]